MMRLKGSELMRLQSRTSNFSSPSHVRYIAEALQTIRISNDPIEALSLLYAMWGKAYAKTPHEKKALNDVGTWLERRLLEDPGVEAARIALELAWAARLARIAEASAKRNEGSSHASRQREHAPNRTADGVLFGKHISVIEQRRAAKASQARHERAKTEAPNNAPEILNRQEQSRPAPPPPPTVLPSTFEAEFVNFAEAREAFHTAKNREKSKKPPKARFLAIRPVDIRFRSLADGLACSTLLAGFKALFEAISTAGGGERTFYVQGIAEAQGKRTAIAISLEPSASDAGSS